MRLANIKLFPAVLAGLAMWFSTATFADAVTEVGGAKMYNGRTIVENALNSPDHRTLVKAVKAAGLVETLESDGPFTVFAPTDDAFENLPDGTVESLLKPANKAKLKAVLTYHVVPGQLDAADLQRLVTENGGSAELKTVNGATLTVTKNGHNYVVKDQAGNTASISTYDVYQSNGVIHVMDTVLMPG